MIFQGQRQSAVMEGHVLLVVLVCLSSVCQGGPCADFPGICRNGGTCSDDGLFAVSCACTPGFTGLQCDTDIDYCNPNQCQNGGLCIDGVTNYTCDCPNGFTGTDCELAVPVPTPANSACQYNQCNHGGQCRITFIFGGSITNNINNDDNSDNNQNNNNIYIVGVGTNTNQNGGTITDTSGTFYCNCPAGFSGNTCNIVERVDDACTASGVVCRNSGICVTAADRFYCRCLSGFSGSTCQVQNTKTTGMLRLVDGTGIGSGRLEVFLNSQWGTICSDGSWGFEEATVACRQLGYVGVQATYFDPPNVAAGKPIHLDQLSCSGGESNLYTQCTSNPNSFNNGCNHSSDVGLACTP